VKPVALALLVLAVASPARATPVVTSDSACPSAAEVSAQVANLWLGERATSVAAHIRLDGARLLIDLVSDNEPVVTRGLPLESDCRSRAQAAALVITAWLDMVSADPVGLPPMAPPDPVQAASATVAPTPPRFAPRMLLGTGGYASMDEQGVTALLSGEAVWPRMAGWLGLRAGLSFPLPRTMAVGQGRSRWWRPVLDLGVILPLHEGTWNLTTSAGPALGLLVVSGKDFDRNHNDVVLSWGALLGLRLGYARASGSTVWVELRGLLWPWAQSIRNEVTGTTPRESALPRVEGHLGLGWSFAAF
jgi:hypothetical protein